MTTKKFYARTRLRRSPEEHRACGYDYDRGCVVRMPRDRAFRYEAMLKAVDKDFQRAGVQPSNQTWQDNPHVRAAALVPWKDRPVTYLQDREDCRMLRAELREEHTFVIRYDLLYEIVRAQWDQEARTYFWIRANYHANRGNFDTSAFQPAAKALGLTSRTISTHIRRLVSRGWVVRTGIGRYRFIAQNKLAARHASAPSPVVIRARVTDLASKQIFFAAAIKAEIHRTHKSTRLVTPHPLTGSDQAVLPRAGLAELIGIRPETVSRRMQKTVRDNLVTRTPTAKELVLGNYRALKDRLPSLQRAYPGGRLIPAMSVHTGQALFVAPGPNIYAADGMAVHSRRIPTDRIGAPSPYMGVPIAFHSRYGKKLLRQQYCADAGYPVVGTPQSACLYESLGMLPQRRRRTNYCTHDSVNTAVSQLVSLPYCIERSAVLRRQRALMQNHQVS